MKKSPHVIWVCPSSKSFYRTKGEVRCRPGSVIPRLAEKGIRLNVLIPHDPTLLPKTRLAPGRTTHHTVKLSQDYGVEIIKLTRGSISPGIYMAKTPPLEPALTSAVFAKTAIALANQLKKPVDIFHIFDWESAMLPLFLEMEKNGSKIFRETRTFLNVNSLREQGNFAPAILAY
ncbi:MAG: glycogen/starch synthase, partial [Elusimicrobia bacterium]|nr:glycogen/starch synthase [Elusimicrobiota bacterium]